MTVRVQATNDSPQLTVAAMMKDPLFIPTLILSDIDQLFVADKLLRAAGKPEGGSVVYYESTPLFADNSSEYVEEFGEIPVTTTSLGTPKAVRVRKRGLGVRVSQEMIDRNQVDRVNTQLSQVRETMVSDYDGAFITALLNASTNTLSASTVWATSTTVRRNVLAARKLIIDQKMGFIPDVLLVNPAGAIDLMTSSEIQQIFVGNIADQNPMYNGKLTFQFAGLDVWQSYSVPSGTAVVLQTKKVGGYADERPLQATPLYVESKPNETWRSDAIRSTAVFIDQPKAATIISGV